MSLIKSKDTSPEITVRKILHSLGYRFRLHDKKLPGNPDIVLKKYNSIILVHGCFWHQHSNCKKSNIPKSNKDYWRNKLDKNVIRDKNNKRKLKNEGWKVITIWECECANKNKIIKKIRKYLVV